MLVKFIQDQTHTVDETVHVTGTIVASVLASFDQSLLERFKVSHPFEGERVILNVRLVEDEDEG